MTHESLFFEIAMIMVLAAVLGGIGHKLRQPLLIMFMMTGIIAGPAGLGIISSYEQIELLAHIGIALLLFIVGLKLDLKLIRTTGPVALATGLGQIVFTSAIGFVIALAMGMSTISAAYVAVALTFSSTIIIVKLLTDKKEIDSLHGQIAIGFLIVQDIAAILALVLLTTFGSWADTESSVALTSITIIVKGLGFLGGIVLLMKYVIPRLTRYLAYSLELLTLFAIAWAIFLGAASELLGFSKEVGAFLAGVSLASTEYRDSVGARLTGLRDFLLLFFFVDLGARLDWSAVGSQLGESAVFSVFVLIGTPLLVLVIMGMMGYRRRTSFLAGLTVAQISEFSLIVAALGLSLGHIDKQTMGLITLVGVTTLVASTYMILYSGPLYRFLSAPLKVFERRNPYRETAVNLREDSHTLDVILMGLGDHGSALADYLQRRGKQIIGVDFNPTVLEQWRAKGLCVLYGDMTDPELHEQLPLSKTRWVVSAIRIKELNLALMANLKQKGYAGKTAVTALNPEEVVEYRQAGADLVIQPFADAAEQAVDALTFATDYLPQTIDWPIAFSEVRMQSDSAMSGKIIMDIPLRSLTGVFILAVSRAGHVFYNPSPDFQIFPGDRLLLMGPPGELRQAETILGQAVKGQKESNLERFEIAESTVVEGSEMAGRTLADLQFRQKYGVNVVGIRRGDTHLMTPGADERLVAGDRLIVLGTAQAIQNFAKFVDGLLHEEFPGHGSHSPGSN